MERRTERPKSRQVRLQRLTQGAQAFNFIVVMLQQHLSGSRDLGMELRRHVWVIHHAPSPRLPVPSQARLAICPRDRYCNTWSGTSGFRAMVHTLGGVWLRAAGGGGFWVTTQSWGGGGGFILAMAGVCFVI